MAPISYKKEKLEVNENFIAMILLGDQGCANLVAIHNLLAIFSTTSFVQPGRLTEEFIMSALRDTLQRTIQLVNDIPSADAKEAKNTLANIRTLFSLKPRLSGHQDFVKNGSRLLCELLGLPLLHGWVLDPQDKSYAALRDFSHSELADYYVDGKGDHRDVCKSLLERKFTSYGFETLHEELNDGGLALLFCRDRLDVVCKRYDALFIYVVDETIRQQVKQAVWMLFEEHEENIIYFNDRFLPFIHQPHKEKATEWYRELIEKLRKDKEPKEDKGEERKKSSQQRQSDDAGGSSIPSEATGKRAEVGASHHHQDSTVKKSPQQAHSLAAESSESTTRILTTGKGADTVGSHHSDGGEVVVSDQDSRVKKSPQQAHSADGAAESPESTIGILTPGNEAEVKSDKETPDEDERAAVHSADGAAESCESKIGILTIGNEAEVKSDKETPDEDERAAVGNISGSQDGVPKGDASDFLNFLDKFKDNGCSDHYFEGVVAAFASQRPRFYVPYDFIMSFNEPLALKIEDNYSGICEDLKKAVDFYLSKNGVDSPDAVLKILGLPTKSVQCFVDFVESIVLHEHYAVFGESSQALPSYDSRRMGLGFLACIVAKFKTGRCWDGKWSEANMKVKNGTEFVIDLEEDCELSADSGHHDLTTFCKTVLNRLKMDGQFLPHFDELAEDHMLINDCFGDPEKWQRFLVLISYPMALKPPLVRASFICNIYIAGDANSSGEPPRYHPLHSRRYCANWRLGAQKHQLLSKVYNYQHEKSRKYKYILDHWSPTHWHVFKFSRHFIQHALGYTKGEDLIQKVEDISVLDILLSRAISKAIGRSVRFLVLNCGVEEGIFSSVWRHYIGSDYVDKPNLEDSTAGDVVRGLLHSIEQNKSGYMYSEISLYSEPQHVSIITNDTDLIQLQTFLNGISFVCVHNGDHLQYGSVKLRKRICPATEECPEHGVIVVEGPYSAEFDSLYDVLMTADLLTENLPPTL